MSWLNSRLNTIKGQLTNLAQEVLAETTEDQFLDPLEALQEAKRENEELGIICSAKDDEIAILRKQITELQNKTGEGVKISNSVAGGQTSKSPIDKNVFEDGWSWEMANIPSESSGGKPDNDQNSESSSGGEMINIPLDAVQHFETYESNDKRLKKLVAENAALAEKLAQSQSENKQLSANIEELDSDHNLAIQNLLDMKNALQKRCTAISNECDTIKKENKDKINEVEEWKKKYRILENEKEEFDAVKEQMENLKDLLKKKEQDIQELIAKIQKSESESVEADLRDKIDELTRQLEDVEGNKRSLEKKLSESSSSGKASGDEEFIVLQGYDDSQQNREVKDLEEKILRLEEKLSLLVAENDDNSVQIVKLEKLKEEEKNSYEDQKREWEMERKSRDFELSKIENTYKKIIDELNERNDKLLKTLNAEGDKFVDYQSEQTILRNSLEENIFKLEKEIENLQKENERLLQNIPEMDLLKVQLVEMGDNASEIESKLMMENVDLQKKLIDLESLKNQETVETQLTFNEVKEMLEVYTQTYWDGESRNTLGAAFQSIRDKIWKIEVLEKNLKKMSTEIVELQESKTSWDHEKKTLEADLANYESECAELMKNNEILLNELENYKRNKLETIPENEENYVLLETQLEECNNLNRTLEEEYREMSEKIADLENEKNELNTQLATMQHANSSLSENIKDLQMRLETMEGEKCNLIFELNEMKTDDKKCAIDSELNEMRNTNMSLESQLERLSRDHADLVQTMQAQKSSLLEAKKEVELLQKALNDKEENLNELQTKYASISASEDEKARLVAEKVSLEEKLDQVSSDLQKSIDTLSFEKSELIKTLQGKHSENMQYYMEIQRLAQLVQSAEQDKMKTVECQKCRATAVETEKLQDQIKFLREKSDILTTNLLTEQTNQKLLHQEKEDILEQRNNLQKDLDRLREHLVELEESHTQETLEMQNVLDETKAKMVALQDEVSKSSTAYTSASIRANQHAETLQAQYSLLRQQCDDLAAKLSLAEDRESKNQAALVNLQCALEQFQNDKENDIKLATLRLRKELDQQHGKEEQLQKEIAVLNQQLADANQGLLAATRISDQLETCQLTIAGLKEEIGKLLQDKESLLEKLKASESGQADKIEKSLVKSLVIGYVVSSNQNDRSQILKMISSVLGFSQSEVDRVGLNKQQTGWLGSLVPVVPGIQTKDNLMQAFVHFLEQESEPKSSHENMPNLLNYSAADERKISNASTSSRSSIHASGSSIQPGPVQPILLNENILEHFAPTRNSSSILKDILNDS